ncbi:MAG: BMP family ABC transporter substrate-binding protein [bacterium]|nr:BMP family ABC transporter substrate-binding protein [bacterium]
MVDTLIGPHAGNEGVAVDNEGISSGENDGDDDVARLVALTERQHQLWSELRDAKDEDLRNRLFDELSANREELAKLKEIVSSQLDEPTPSAPPSVRRPPDEDSDEPRSVGESLRASLLTPAEGVAPAAPPPPPPPTNAPPVVEDPPVEPELPESPTEPGLDEPNAAADEPAAVSSAAEEGEEETDESLAPEATPFSSREADLAATRGRRESSIVRRPLPEPEPQPVDDGTLEQRRESAHQAYQDLARVRPEHTRPFPIFAILVAVLSVAVVIWLLFFRSDGSTEAAPEETTTTTTAAGVVATDSTVDQIRAVLDGLGYSSVMVEERSGTIYLAGIVGSEDDRTAAVAATVALAGDKPVDSGAVSVGEKDQGLRVAALEAIAAAGYEKINVSVSGEVATLTGVTPGDGSAGLIAAVISVDGINQVVDLTETSDRAAALDSELQRITAVTPIIFQSGASSLTPLQERILDSAAEIIQAYPGPVVTVVGYTDAGGSSEENKRISVLRAERVRDYLVVQGVPAERLVVDGRGEDTASGSAAVAGLERRVEFEVGYAVLAGTDDDFRIGIVAPSARDDLAFTQSIVDAVSIVAAEHGGVSVDISDGLFVPEDAEAAIRGYAAGGYDLVIAHGSQYGTALASIAPEFPGTAFAWGTAADTFGIPNVSAYEVAANEGGYVMGVVAALLTESDVIGVVGPLEVGDAALFVNGFRNGILATDSGISVPVTYTGSFSEVTLAAEAASAHVDAGADVLTGSAQMVVGAVGVASENGALWFGNQANQTELAPELVVASQVYHWEVALRQIVADIELGVLGGETYTLTLADGGIVIEYNSGYQLPAQVRTAADNASTAISQGDLSTDG